MKNNLGSFDKFKHSSNHLKLKSILSIFTIGIFIFLGFASIDEEDPETRVLDDCEFLHPSIDVTHICSFSVLDEAGKYLKNASIKFSIKEYEKVGNSSLCNLVLKNSYTKTLDFGSTGKASFSLSKKYLSNDDLIEIYFKTYGTGYYLDPYNINLHKGDRNFDYPIIYRLLNPYP